MSPYFYPLKPPFRAPNQMYKGESVVKENIPDSFTELKVCSTTFPEMGSGSQYRCVACG